VPSLDITAGDWLSVGVAVVIAAGTLVWARRQRPRREIRYAVLYDHGLLSERAQGFGLEVRHDGRVVERARQVVVRAVNFGTEPIAAADYEEPLRITVADAVVLSNEVSLKRPPGLTISVQQADESEVVLSKVLLNPEDMFEVRLLVDGGPSQVSMSGRVSGVKEIGRETLPQTSWGDVWKFSRVDHAMTAVVTLAILGIAAAGVSTGTWAGRAVALAFFAVGLWFPWRVLTRNRQNRLFLGR
jgi:hypothetical protein